MAKIESLKKGAAMSKRIVGLFLIAIFISLFGVAGTTHAAGGAQCDASPSVAQVGTVIHISCTGFDRDVLVNAYVVEPTGFSEVGRSNYAVCLVGTRTNSFYDSTSKVDESGTAAYNWYTQDGSRMNPCNYEGYANQLGTYTVVVQELDGKGGIKYAGKVNVTLTGNTETHTGAMLDIANAVYSGDVFTLSGSGFAPNEYVNVWFTRPADCSGLGWWYYTGVSAFSPSGWSGAGILGPDSVKADENGNFVATYSATDYAGSYPCLGQWSVTARALGSGLGAEAQFTMKGKSISGNASVWTDESSVPSIGQRSACWGGQDQCGVAVHVHGSGFPANSVVNCWFTRPDGVVYDALTPGASSYSNYAAFQVGAGGQFSGLASTWTSDVGYQGEQPGTWHISCGTPDRKYSGAASFTVYALPFVDP
jgi:hypothetical protein